MSVYETGTNLQKNSGVLITGGSGLIGKRLTASLLSAGYRVSHLSRKRDHSGNIMVFMWDPQKSIIDPDAFEGIDYLIHLAGANIGAKRWTRKRKIEITESRSGSARFLYKTVIDRDIRLKAFISASAAGVYGSVTSMKIFTENDPPAGDFLGSVCKSWEESADLFRIAGIRTVIIRAAVVLEKNDSALSKLMISGRFGFLIKTGNGRQYMPWIHINDLCNIYIKAIEDTGMMGAYNAVAPQHVTHSDFMRSLGRIMSLPVLAIPVPGFVLRLILGEMSEVILKGSRISPEKLINSGYKFFFSELEDSLKNIILG
jgi:uncharacterized protein